MSRRVRQSLASFLCDVEPITVGDAVSKMIHKLQHWRLIKITVCPKFVAECEQRAYRPCSEHFPLQAVILAEHVEVVPQIQSVSSSVFAHYFADRAEPSALTGGSELIDCGFAATNRATRYA